MQSHVCPGCSLVEIVHSPGRVRDLCFTCADTASGAAKAPGSLARAFAAGPAARAITAPCAGHGVAPVRVLILEDMPGPSVASDPPALPDGRTFTEAVHDLFVRARQHPCEMAPVLSNAPGPAPATSDHAAINPAITLTSTEKDLHP